MPAAWKGILTFFKLVSDVPGYAEVEMGIFSEVLEIEGKKGRKEAGEWDGDGEGWMKDGEGDGENEEERGDRLIVAGEKEQGT